MTESEGRSASGEEKNHFQFSILISSDSKAGSAEKEDRRGGNKEKPRMKTVVRKSPAVPVSSDSSGNIGQGSSIS